MGSAAAAFHNNQLSFALPLMETIKTYSDKSARRGELGGGGYRLETVQVIGRGNYGLKFVQSVTFERYHLGERCCFDRPAAHACANYAFETKCKLAYRLKKKERANGKSSGPFSCFIFVFAVFSLICSGSKFCLKRCVR